MDGREFVHMPSPLLSGLHLEGAQGGAGGVANRLASSTGHVTPLPTTKCLPVALNLQSSPGGFYITDQVGQSTLHSQTSMLRTSASQAKNFQLHDKDHACYIDKNSKDAVKDSKEWICRNEFLLASSKEDGKLKDELHVHSVVDLAMDAKMESEKKRGEQQRLSTIGEHISPFLSELLPNLGSSSGETKLKSPLQTSLLSKCKALGDPISIDLCIEQDRCAKDQSRHDEHMRPSSHTALESCKSVRTTPGNLQEFCSCSSSMPPQPSGKVIFSSTFPAQPVHPSMYTVFPSAKELGREHKVIAPTFVPSVKAYEEINRPIQIASQAQDLKSKDCSKAGEKAEVSQEPLPQELSHPSEAKRFETVREKGSVIRSNSSVKGTVASYNLNSSGLASPENRDFITCKETYPQPSERTQHPKEASKVFGIIESPQKQTNNSQIKLLEQKWKPFDIGNFAATQMAVLAAQHSQNSRTEEEAKKMYLDSSNLIRSTGSCRTNSETLHPSTRSDCSAMQNLIKYSGNFAKETAAWQSSSKKSPFGGLGNMKLDASQSNSSKQDLPHLGGKRDPERSDSARSIVRESMSVQGEVEGRHPPVGIAVAVARQKDNGGSKIGCVKGTVQVNEDGRDECVHHRDDHLLVGRLDREQEKLLWESKNLADFARMHPLGFSANGLNANLIVTGGPTFTTSGCWPVESTSYLPAYSWIPRGATQSIWLAGHPYGLAHPALHHGMSSTFTLGMAPPLPSAYHFSRDPQSGQIVVIPTEQISHFDILDRTPTYWPAMYSPTRSPLQHAHQLQLLSQQQILRQHELYMMKQQSTHAMELQRSAQLDAFELQRGLQLDALELQRGVQLDAVDFQRSAQNDSIELLRNTQFVGQIKMNEQQSEAETKATKQSPETSKRNLVSRLGQQQRKVISQSVADSYSKALCTLSSNSSSEHVLKAKCVHKLEEPTQEPYEYFPNSHPPSPPSVSSPPPSAVITSEADIPVDADKKELGGKKDDPSTFQELSSGNPCQSLPPSFRQYTCLIQPTAAKDFTLDDHLPTEISNHTHNLPKAKSTCSLISESFGLVIPLTAVEPKRGTMKTGEETQEGVCSQAIEYHSEEEAGEQETYYQSVLLQKSETDFNEERDHQILHRCRTECTSKISPDACKDLYSTHTDFRSAFIQSDSDHENLILTPQNTELTHTKGVTCVPNIVSNGECTKNAINVMEYEHDIPHSGMENLSYELFKAISMDLKSEDPLAGMNALVAAAEMPQASPMNTVIMTPDLSLDFDLLQGIALLSEIAEIELEKTKKEMENLQRGHVRASLESLLTAGTQMLMEILSCPVPDYLKAESIRLPRELNPDKKYSWMKKKTEQSVIQNMDSLEIDYRVRLAELQRKYKQKQRELSKLQRREDSEEKCDEKSRSLGRRGPGRPRKRKHRTKALSSPHEKEKSGSKTSKLSKCILISQDLETGECERKKQMNIFEEEEMGNVSGNMRN
ncbi:trinucleotide repeat-containing gene 18 protein-like [Rhinophrynus dorsalis]